MSNHLLLQFKQIIREPQLKIVDTQITQKIEDFVGGTPGVETIDSFSEDESSRITLTFQTGLDLDDATNDVRSSVSRVRDNLPEGAEQPEIYKQSAGMRTTMWLSFSSDTMSDLETNRLCRQVFNRFFFNCSRSWEGKIRRPKRIIS